MAQYFKVHDTHPQHRLIAKAAQIIKNGGVIAYPTDSCYAIGCRIGDAQALQRLRLIRNIDDRHHVTLVCRNLSEIATYARIDNACFRLLKKLTPGSYTFILEATREVPRRLLHAKRKTIGIRIPRHAVVEALLDELNEPLLSATAIAQGSNVPFNDPVEIRQVHEHELDLVIDSGPCGIVPTTVIDLTGQVVCLIREGKGELGAIGLQA